MINNPDVIKFQEFFKEATDYNPYPFQTKLALAKSLPSLLDVPTGMGKTDAVFFAWLWRRRFSSQDIRDSTPRRLIYCLPMRVLVEQTRDKISKWLMKLGLLAEGPSDSRAGDGWADKRDHCGDRISVTVLMGGEDKDDWDFFPDKDAVIIGTQDMLLSRVLNRGYGMSRYRWPIHFALLNNDSLWIVDEVQLMGVGGETSAQLQAFREILKTEGPSHTIWMSATLDLAQLQTVDHDETISGDSILKLDNKDLGNPILKKRYESKKAVSPLPLKLSKDNQKKEYAQEVAKEVLTHHQPDTLTLVVINNVKRTQSIFKELLKSGRTEENTVLIHSRFRPLERQKKIDRLGEEGDRIVVSTQVVEAGVDISATTLITELASWPSMVQRFGRCNRYGECDSPNILWMDIDTEEEGLPLPYSVVDAEKAREILNGLNEASPSSLTTIEYLPPPAVRLIIRRKDMLELFDTTPDLTGNDIDVSRYIRDEKDKDVQVYWRDLPEEGPEDTYDRPKREELCQVPISGMAKYLKGLTGWAWDHLESHWISLGKGGERRNVRPGQVILLDSKKGGYHNILGWTGETGKGSQPVEVIKPDGPETPSDGSMNEDAATHVGIWKPLVDHCRDVKEEVSRLASRLPLSDGLMEPLQGAALWHDIGKAHEAFQNMLIDKREEVSSIPSGGPPWAKSDNWIRGSKYWVKGDFDDRIERPYFRHELASALAWLQASPEEIPNRDFIAYIICAHHGKVRQSIRSLPNENEPFEEGRPFARGIWQGDRLPPVPGILDDEMELDLNLMYIGEGSWLEHTLLLRDRYGPFRLSLYEAILRIADWRVSKAYEEVV